jgi:hypothetical protein
LYNSNIVRKKASRRLIPILRDTGSRRARCIKNKAVTRRKYIFVFVIESEECATIFFSLIIRLYVQSKLLQRKTSIPATESKHNYLHVYKRGRERSLSLSLSFLLVVLDKTNVFGVLAEALTADHDVVFADDRVLVGAHAAVY